MNPKGFRLAERLGADFPLVQAPMAGAQGSAMALAVAGAGGVGSLPCAMLGADDIRLELRTIAAATTRRVNLNFFCHTPPVRDEARERAWRALLRPFHLEMGLDPDALPAAPTRAPFTSETADLLDEFSPTLVSFHFGLPSDELLARVRGWGATILASATTVDEARWLEAHGVHVIIAQGSEAGGHRGMFLTDDITTQAGTFALLPQVVAAVNVPVIAAGGIADAVGIAAAMRLGASGVQVGTAYLRCPESTVTALHRAALASPDASHTALTNLFTGRPARGIVNRVMRKIGAINASAPAFPLALEAMGPLRTAAERQGLADFSPLWAGQNVSGCREVPAAELTTELARGFLREFAIESEMTD